MTVTRRQRVSTSGLVAAITHVSYGDPEDDLFPPDVTVPDGLWDIVVIRHAGAVQVLQTGLINQARGAPVRPGR
jgi:hypothetical protein